jgi:hypothetical protein
LSFVKPVIHWVRAWLGPGSSQFEFESVTRKANKPRLIRRSMSWPLIHNSEVWCGVEAGFCFVIFCSVFFFVFSEPFLSSFLLHRSWIYWTTFRAAIFSTRVARQKAKGSNPSPIVFPLCRKECCPLNSNLISDCNISCKNKELYQYLIRDPLLTIQMDLQSHAFKLVH